MTCFNNNLCESAKAGLFVALTGFLQVEMKELKAGAMEIVFPAAFLMLHPEKWLTVETSMRRPGSCWITNLEGELIPKWHIWHVPFQVAAELNISKPSDIVRWRGAGRCDFIFQKRDCKGKTHQSAMVRAGWTHPARLLARPRLLGCFNPCCCQSPAAPSRQCCLSGIENPDVYDPTEHVDVVHRAVIHELCAVAELGCTCVPWSLRWPRKRPRK